MSPAIAPIQVVVEAAPKVETILPRMTFNPPVNRAESVNAQVEANHALATLARTYIPESIGALKGDHKTIIAKLDAIILGIQDIQERVTRLESGE